MSTPKNDHKTALKYFNDNQGLQYTAIKRFRSFVRTPMERDDLDQIANLLFWQACQVYDPKQGKLSTIAYLVAKHNAIRYIKPYFKDTFSQNKPLPKQNTQTKDRDIDDHLDGEAIHKALKHTQKTASQMIARKIEILLQRTLKNKTLQELSITIGVTRERIRQIENSAIEMIKEIFHTDNQNHQSPYRQEYVYHPPKTKIQPSNIVRHPSNKYKPKDNPMNKCRKCGTENATIYLNAMGKPTKTPICPDCYEDLIRKQQNSAHRTVGATIQHHGKDPDHDHLDFNAQNWYENQIDQWNE